MLDAIAEASLRLAARVGKRPWIAAVVCVVVCSLLAARAVGHVLEAQVLSDARTAPAIPMVEQPPAPAPVVRDRTGLGAALVARDMFCSTCAPVVVAPPAGGGEDGGVGVPVTSLPLILIATSLGHEPIATVRDDRSGSQGAFAKGDALPGAGGGAITRIGATYVDFINVGAGREERVSLLALAAPGKGMGKGMGTVEAPVADANPYADRVKSTGDQRWEVERGLVRELVGAAGKPLPGVRMMPAVKDGKLAGVRVLQALPTSVAGALGLKPGDTLSAVNGVEITSYDKMLELYTKLDDMNVVTIDGMRAGKAISWQYNLR